MSHPPPPATNPPDDADDHTVLHSAGSAAPRTPTVSPSLGPRKRFGDYELTRELARGGMGVVFEATQISLARTVAVKMILAGEFASDEQVQRFFAEARSVAHLDHPNIVPVYEVGEHAGLHFFSMKLVDGGSLTARLPWFENKTTAAAELVEKVARAVHHAHLRGVLHRDLKPGNILLDAAGEPLVTDFGLAKLVDDDSHMTRSDAIVGTPAYMAPEQARGVRNATTATDTWALGAILYHLLTGVPPFKAESALKTLQLVTDAEPVRPRQRRPGIPRDLETVCLKCLNKDPAKRYATAGALADDLRRFVAGEPVDARPVGRAERVWRWCRRNPGLAVSGGIAAAAVVAALATLSVAVVLISAGRDAARTLADRNADLAADKATLAEKEQNLRRLAEHESAGRLLDQAVTRCATEDAAVGLLWLARSLEEADRVGATDVATSARRQLSAWGRQVHPLRAVVRCEPPDGTGRRTLALSPDGATLYAGGVGAKLRAFDAATGKPRGEPLTLAAEPTCLAVEPSGRRLLIGFGDGKLVWADARSLRLTSDAVPVHAAGVAAVAISRDGKVVLSADADGVAIAWDVKTGAPIGVPLKLASAAAAVALSADGTRAAAGSPGGVVRVWRVPAAATSDPSESIDAGSDVWALRFAADGAELVVVAKASVQRFDLRDGGAEPMRSRPLPEGAFAAGLAADGSRALVAESGDVVRVLELVDDRRSTAPLRHAGRLADCVALSDDGSTLATRSVDGTARVWATRPDAASAELAVAAAECVAWSPDGNLLATGGGDDVVRVFDARTHAPLAEMKHDGLVTSLAFSPDGRLLLTGSRDATARLWTARDGKPAGPPIAHDGAVTLVAFDAAGTLLLTAANDDRVRVRRTSDLSPVGPDIHHAGLRSAALSPAGKHVVTAGDDATARLWHLADARDEGVPLEHDGGAVWSAVFSPDGTRIATAGQDRTARVWDVATGKLVGAPFVHPAEVLLVAWSPDGGRLGTGDHDGSARVWDVAAGVAVAGTVRRSQLVTVLAFSPDGTMLATGSQEGSAGLFEANTGRAIGPPIRHADAVTALAFHPSGDRLAVASRAGTVRLVPTVPLPGLPAEVSRWVRRTTGLVLDGGGAVAVEGE